MKRIVYAAIAAFGLSVSPLASQADVLFDQTGASGGTLTFDGNLGSSLLGTGITFDEIVDSDLPATLACAGCLFNFTTGPATSLGPDLWEFGPSGSFTIIGDAFDGATQENDTNTIASGTIDASNFSSLGTLNSGLNIQVGSLVLDTGVADFFGEPADGWDFVNSQVALQGCDYNGSAFNCKVTNADLDAIQVSEPHVALLLGLGLMGVGYASRKRRTK